MLSGALALPLVVAVCAAPAHAQPTRLLSRLTSSDGTRYRVELRAVPDERVNVLTLAGPAEEFDAPTLFSRATRLWSFRYGMDRGGSEWVFFRAQDARHVTQYTWYFRTGQLRYVATDRRTGRVRRGTAVSDGLPVM